MKQLYFVRHGQTLWNAIHRMQGQLNSDLSKLGRSQANINGELLAKHGIEALISSPLGRTTQTAEIINKHLNLSIRFDERIKEWDCGDWSGHLFDEVRKKWPKEWQAFETDRFHYRGPNCENMPDMIARTQPFLSELTQHTATNIAIVSHGLIGKIMVSMLLKLDAQQTLEFGQSNDVILRVTIDNDQTTATHFINGKGPFDGHQSK